MDPEELLTAAAALIEEGDMEDARELLEAYYGWRARGGFEPHKGDGRARILTAKVHGVSPLDVPSKPKPDWRPGVVSRKVAKKKAARKPAKKRAKKAVKSMPLTVESIFVVLTANLTQYDRRYGRNPYALGRYFEQVEKIQAVVPSGPLTESSAAAIERGLNRHFIVSDMPPVKKTIKQMRAALEGKPLKYPVSK